MVKITVTFDVYINYQNDALTSFVPQVIVILRMDCALGLTHRILWKTSLIGQGVVVQHQVILLDHRLITQQAQQKVGTFFIYFFSPSVTCHCDFFLRCVLSRTLQQCPAFMWLWCLVSMVTNLGGCILHMQH